MLHCWPQELGKLSVAIFFMSILLALLKSACGPDGGDRTHSIEASHSLTKQRVIAQGSQETECPKRPTAARGTDGDPELTGPPGEVGPPGERGVSEHLGLLGRGILNFFRGFFRLL